MQYPFRMYGRIIQLFRYKIIYTITLGDEESTQQEQVDYCATLDEANSISERYPDASIEVINTHANEWLDGIEVPDVPDTFAEAIKIYEMGPEAYQRKLAFEERKQLAQIRADIDFIAAMQEVSL